MAPHVPRETPADPFWTEPDGMAAMADQLEALAHQLVEPLVCRTPAYGAPGRDHCAACCYGTGYVVTCAEDQQLVDAADAMRTAARQLRADHARLAEADR